MRRRINPTNGEQEYFYLFIVIHIREQNLSQIDSDTAWFLEHEVKYLLL